MSETTYAICGYARKTNTGWFMPAEGVLMLGNRRYSWWSLNGRPGEEDCNIGGVIWIEAAMDGEVQNIQGLELDPPLDADDELFDELTQTAEEFHSLHIEVADLLQKTALYSALDQNNKRHFWDEKARRYWNVPDGEVSK